MIRKFYKCIQAFSNKVTSDGAAAYASDATLFIVVSFFPFLMFLLTLLQYLPFTQNELMEVIRSFVPSQVADTIGNLVDELYSSTSFILSLTIVGTLWTASRGILGVHRGLNRIYDASETRNYFLLRLKVMLFTLVFAIMLLMLLALYVFGGLIKNWLTEEFPILMQNKYTDIVVNLKILIGGAILMVFFLVMYEFIPNRSSRLFRELPGAVLASVGWIGFSYGYSFYINNMSSMRATYGSLTAIVLCVIWLYSCMTIFFLGAEVNSCIVLPEFRELFRRKKPSEKAAETPVEGAVDAGVEASVGSEVGAALIGSDVDAALIGSDVDKFSGAAVKKTADSNGESAVGSSVETYSETAVEETVESAAEATAEEAIETGAEASVGAPDSKPESGSAS